MTFWSGEKLEEIGPNIGLVDPFDKKKIDCSAYTLTLGPECFITPQFDAAGPAFKQHLDPVRYTKSGNTGLLMSGGEVIIPAGQFAFLLTEEIVRFPANAMGFISLKSTQKFKGLINVSGFHVDPGFCGRLIYSVYNAGPASIHLFRGEQLFLLWVADLDRSSLRIKDAPMVTEISSRLITEVDLPLHSLQSLSKKIEKLQRDLSLVYRVLTALAVIGSLVFALWALLPSSHDSSDKAVAVEIP